ncbi:MAG TPA: phosphotyrosine protein phosphatase [Natronosporangium sp.]|nr:phosphotyrosine protein phosphatase [Natronosporangium sp.]
MPPFTVLHVCMGNICRSPMAERLLRAAVAELSGLPQDKAEALVHSHSAGTGGWHAGEPMHPPAARQVRARGGDDAGFTARRLEPAHIDASDLVLCATVDQAYHVRSLRPDAASRTFVMGEFRRFLSRTDLADLPPVDLSPHGVHARGVALVAAVDKARDGRPARPTDEVDDPFGHGDGTYTRVADEIEDTVRSLAAALLGPASPPAARGPAG